MRKLILQEFVSLDGLAAGPNGSVDFVPKATQGDQAFGREQMKLIDEVDTILLGRVTYQMFSGFWPNVKEGDDKAFADKLNATHKIVFSRTLGNAPWGDWADADIVNTDAPAEVARLKQEAGKAMLVWGSLSVAQTLVNSGLVDEYRCVLCPVVLGAGLAMFSEIQGPREMTLSSVKQLDRGAVLLTYR